MTLAAGRPLRMFLWASVVPLAGLVLLAVEPAFRYFHASAARERGRTIVWEAPSGAEVKAEIARVGAAGFRLDGAERRRAATGVRSSPVEAPAAEAADESDDAVPGSRESMDAKWAEEPRDPEWADRTEKRLRELLDARDIGSLIVNGANCRSTLCRLEASPAVTTELGKLASLQRELDLPVWMFADYDEHGEHPVFYVERRP